MGKEDESPAPCEPSSSAARDSESSEKHLSKAQFVCQIKGKYHLKCSNDEDPLNGDEDSSAVISKDSPEDRTASDTESSALIQDSSTLDADDASDLLMSGGNKSRTECWVRRWQTRQYAKACVDNTINCVLEDMGFVPLPADAEEMDDGTLEREAVSMAILCHGLQRSDHVTATTSSQVVSRNSYATKLNADFQGRISSHHYHKVKSVFHESPTSEVSCSASSSKTTFQNGNVESDQVQELLSSSQSENVIVGEPISRTSDVSENLSSDTLNEKMCILSDGGLYSIGEVKKPALSDFSTNAHNYQSPCEMSSKTANIVPPTLKRKAQVVSTDNSKRCCDGRLPPPSTVAVSSSSDDSSSGGASSVQTLYEKASLSEHFDFMDAAVAAAIQKKGLSTMTCTEYG